MKHIDRRRFLLATAAAAALPHLRSFAQAAAPATATLTLLPSKAGPHVPANFIGLSYETQQLTTPEFFSAANTGLIAQFKALAPHGVLRIGGNTSDIGWWKATPASRRPEIHVRDIGGGEPTSDLAYPITPEAITNLRAFLEATGWTCIYGINLGTNTPVRAAEEAAFVAPTLGPKLEYFQLGNEPDLYSSHLRDKATWNANVYMDEWLTEANAIRARVPDARFGMPDIASNAEWFASIGSRLSTTPNVPTIAAVSHHYYIGGPPSNPEMTIAHILAPNPRVAKDAALVQAAAAKLHSPYRMTEGNTCYRGGKPGVSDVFAASLWAADYLLELASLGYAGVNLHGGDGQAVANSLGGKLPGDEIVLAQHGDPTQHPHPYYTPIAHIGDKYVAEPVFYGMLFAQQFAGTSMIPLDFDTGHINATAYAADTVGVPGQRGGTSGILAIINKDASQDLSVSLPKGGSTYSITHRLTGASLEARTARYDEVDQMKKNGVITVAKSSAILLRRYYK
jgi:hypothetical protein